MAVRTLPPTHVLNQLFRYDPKTGRIWHRARKHTDFPSERAWIIWSVQHVNQIATSRTKVGYLTVRIDNRNYLAHRVAFKMMNGIEPPDVLDHINGDKADNSINNIRAATKSTNGFNRAADKDNRTGYKGVTYIKKARRYTSVLVAKGKRHYVGCFPTAEEAYAAYVAKAKEFHGEFFRDSRPVRPA